MPDTNDIDIDALQAQLMKAREDEGWFITGDQAKDFSRALTALVAERDALRKNTTELESELTAYAQRVSDLIAEKWRLQDRIRELEARPPADRDLRERLMCAALTGLCADSRHDYAESVAVVIADRTLAAMRKGATDGK